MCSVYSIDGICTLLYTLYITKFRQAAFFPIGQRLNTMCLFLCVCAMWALVALATLAFNTHIQFLSTEYYYMYYNIYLYSNKSYYNPQEQTAKFCVCCYTFNLSMWWIASKYLYILGKYKYIVYIEYMWTSTIQNAKNQLKYFN